MPSPSEGPRPTAPGPSTTTATTSERDGSLADSRFVVLLRLLKLLLTVLTLAVSLWKATGLA